MKYFHGQMSVDNKNKVHIFASSFYKKLIGGEEDKREGPMSDEVSKEQHSRVR